LKGDVRDGSRSPTKWIGILEFFWAFFFVIRVLLLEVFWGLSFSTRELVNGGKVRDSYVVSCTRLRKQVLQGLWLLVLGCMPLPYERHEDNGGDLWVLHFK
jgi:hypothetical protein